MKLNAAVFVILLCMACKVRKEPKQGNELSSAPESRNEGKKTVSIDECHKILLEKARGIRNELYKITASLDLEKNITNEVLDKVSLLTKELDETYAKLTPISCEHLENRDFSTGVWTDIGKCGEKQFERKEGSLRFYKKDSKKPEALFNAVKFALINQDCGLNLEDGKPNDLRCELYPEGGFADGIVAVRTHSGCFLQRNCLLSPDQARKYFESKNRMLNSECELVE